MKHHRLDLHRFSAVHLVQAGFRLALPGALAMGLCWQVPVPRLPAVLLLAAALGIVQGASFAAIPQPNADGGGRSLAAGAVGFAVPLCPGGILVHSLQARRRQRD